MVALMRSLIVEDNPVNQLFLKRILSKYGDCHAHANALDGIKAFTRALDSGNPYQLVCLDVSMEGLDGVNALKRIRAIEAERGVFRHDCVRIFMVTSVGDEHVVKSAVSLSDAYLLKPIDHKTLVGTLRKLHLIDAPSDCREEFEALCKKDQIPPVHLARLAQIIQESLDRQAKVHEESAVAVET